MVLVDSKSVNASPEATDTLTAPTPVLPASVLPATQAPHSLGLWGRRLGQSPLLLFPIALGAGAFGTSVDDAASAAILDEFVDLGGNFIDATSSHPDGRSEQAVGSWLNGRRSRARVLLGTTIGHHHDLSENPARVTTHAVEAALGRLRTDHLDLLSIRLAAESSVEEALIAADDLIRAGKVRFIAASAPSADRLIQARIAAAQHGVTPLVAVQSRYSLADRFEYEPELARVVALQGTGFMPRQPLAGGLLTGRYRTRDELARLRRRGDIADVPARRRTSILAAVSTIAAELSVTPAGVSLAWLLTRTDVTAPIVSASTPQQVDDSMSAVRIQLTRQQAAELERASR
jgi:aryl-alcohol dehydrogenase-like predicted oxidoreductase